MARLLPFYRTGGLLSGGGGGGGALGDATVWPTVADWASLGTIAGPLRVGDRVEVSDLQPGLAYAARYSGADWELAQAVFPTVADLLDFPELIFTSATAIVGTGIETDPMYYYDGSNWQRMADGVPFAWDITDLTNIDPSGIGATQIGDFARYTNPTTSAVEVYRLRAVALGATAGTGSVTMWVPASIYGEANLTIRGYLIGTETMPASGSSIQGYLVTASGASASVTTSGGEVVLASTTASHFANVQSTYVLTENDRVYVRMNLRLSQTGGVNSSFYNLLYDNGTTKSQFITAQNPTAPVGNTNKYLPTTGGIVLVGSTAMIRSTGTPITNTAELLEILADGTVDAGPPINPDFMVNVSRNARPYFSMRRAAQTGTATGQHLLQVLNGATGAQSARFSYLYFMTY